MATTVVVGRMHDGAFDEESRFSVGDDTVLEFVDAEGKATAVKVPADGGEIRLQHRREFPGSFVEEGFSEVDGKVRGLHRPAPAPAPAKKAAAKRASAKPAAKKSSAKRR